MPAVRAEEGRKAVILAALVILGAFGVVLGVGGCTTSAREVREARQSGYMTDFAVVYSAALNATRDKYPTIVESPTSQLIATAWHQLKLSTGTVNDSQSSLQGTGQQPGTTNVQRTRYYVRFRVYVLGGKPFRIRIEGQASEWEVGEIPTPLRGAEIPSWLEARTDSLRVEIHRRLKEHAVPLEDNVKKSKQAKGVPLQDTKTFGDLPEAAGEVIAKVAQAADGRDAAALRRHLSDDVVWARGAGGADAAVAVWAADSTKLGALSESLAAGCEVTESEVICPTGRSTGTHVARFRLVDGIWKLVSFFQE